MIAAAILAIVLTLQTPPDFSGTWVIDQARSSAAGGGRGSGRGEGTGRGGGLGLGAAPNQLTITQTAEAMTVEERGDGGITNRVTYSLTGARTTNPIGAGRNSGGTATYASKWKGQRLETTVVTPLAPNRGGSAEYLQKLSLDRDGRLVVEITVSGRPGGRKTVYTRR